MAAEGNLWAFAWSHRSRQLLSVRNIMMNKHDTEREKEVILDIGEPIHVRMTFGDLNKTSLTDSHYPLGHAFYFVPALHIGDQLYQGVFIQDT